MVSDLTMTSIATHPFDPGVDQTWAATLLDQTLGGRYQAKRGELLDVLEMPGIVAFDRARPSRILELQGGVDSIATWPHRW